MGIFFYQHHHCLVGQQHTTKHKMYRVAVRTASRQTLGSLRLAPAQRRMASSAVKAGPRTWKGTALRWGLAIGAVYYYNTSSVFADEMARKYTGKKTNNPLTWQLNPFPRRPPLPTRACRPSTR